MNALMTHSMNAINTLLAFVEVSRVINAALAAIRNVGKLTLNGFALNIRRILW
ncbi:hypothetical protein DSCO28_73800 (plasmid) [Desulfosarcina ovata subsp. sediminis]|uniref:Uncharacterized protein n=1 Tax=Desulfosarcina ovata subsp. sediminis TaxID=885957 RepID=A0A5K8A384_9BACT|nr:hypothetical protein DSCO28_73800 [Desulfosarcina ovata subsp. sediminis]